MGRKFAYRNYLKHMTVNLQKLIYKFRTDGWKSASKDAVNAVCANVNGKASCNIMLLHFSVLTEYQIVVYA
jgi:hypothetical protein